MTGLGSSRFNLLVISALISESSSVFKASVNNLLAVSKLLFPKNFVKVFGIFPSEPILIGNMLTKFDG
jgi:hypothetical protein